jgi:uncharacterized repeat protein (TIGR01451 family)
MQSRRPAFFSLLVASAAFAATPAHASGVSAGTLIQNTASATYSSGSGSTTVQSNTVSVTVNQLIDVAVAGLNSSPVTATATATLSYSVTNSGNGNDSFNLTVDPNLPGNPFVGTVQTIAVDTNNNGQFDSGVDQTISAGGATPVIAPDGSLNILVVVALPAGATDTQTSQVKLTATSIIGSGTPGTLFSGKGVGGVDAVVGMSRAAASGLDSLGASLAAVALTKSAVIADPFGGVSPVPGALVTYKIVASFAGSGSANGVHVTDSIPTGTTYQPGTLALDGTSLSDSTDADAGTAGASGIDVALGNIAGGSANKSITFKVKID